MARIMKDNGNTTIRGIGIDEQTAVCIDQNGIGKVYGINDAYFLINQNLGRKFAWLPIRHLESNHASHQSL